MHRASLGAGLGGRCGVEWGLVGGGWGLGGLLVGWEDEKGWVVGGKKGWVELGHGWSSGSGWDIMVLGYILRWQLFGYFFVGIYQYFFASFGGAFA